MNEQRLTSMTEINELEGLAERLNAESDSLHKILETLNTKLNKLKLGLPVWISESDRISKVLCIDRSNEVQRQEDEDGLRINVFYPAWDLGYAKTDEGWGIAVRQVLYREFPDGEGGSIEEVSEPGRSRSILKAPRDVRIESAQHLETLVDAIKDKASATVWNIQRARKLAEEL